MTTTPNEPTGEWGDPDKTMRDDHPDQTARETFEALRSARRKNMPADLQVEIIQRALSAAYQHGQAEMREALDIPAIEAARGLCWSEANRWSTREPRTGMHWAAIAGRLDAIVIRALPLTPGAGSGAGRG